MTNTHKENKEEVPPEFEDIISRFESLSLTPASRPPGRMLGSVVEEGNKRRHRASRIWQGRVGKT